MVQFIRKDKVAFVGNRLDNARIAVKARLEGEYRFFPLELCKQLFKLIVNFHVTDDGANRTGSRSVGFDCFNRSLLEAGMIRKAEVVI